MPGAPHETLLTIDATTGQNGLRQALLFREAVDVTGIALTKLDGTAKGGIALAIAQELGVPVKLIGIGEALEDLRPFDPDDFAAGDTRAVSEPGPEHTRRPGGVARAGAGRAVPARTRVRGALPPDGRPVRRAEHSYTRYGNPTLRHYEDAVGVAGGRRGGAVLVRHGRGFRPAPDPARARLRGGDGRRLLPRRATARRGAPRAARGGGAPRAARRTRRRGERRRPALARDALEPGARGLRHRRAGGPRRDRRSWTTRPPARCSSGRSTSAPTYSLTSATKQMSGPRRPPARLRDDARPGARPGAARLATRRRGHPGPVRGLARAPLAPDARAPARARVRQRDGDRAAAGGARRRGGRALPRAAERSRRTRSPAAR